MANGLGLLKPYTMPYNENTIFPSRASQNESGARGLSGRLGAAKAARAEAAGQQTGTPHPKDHVPSGMFDKVLAPRI